MTRNPEFGNVTGTKDKDYDIIWFTEACLQQCAAAGDLHRGRRARGR